ncbi:tRNA-dihydrouridine(47) synthase [NAD(P)(+)]-like [Schistocerca nitens]|uniref:tRNA-dihydrouridine(47) synthase [NAD(P)(+)]-like n=1 Tax=Schistocerca nitens TaxID=7011 RepID=UPI002119347E|nr:tRNA-dihydrouridine(47) synthase [NAD(P)(+)]-like [Schistocerca nitens]
MASTAVAVDLPAEVNGKSKGGVLLIKQEYVISDREMVAVQVEKTENENGEKPAENEDNQPPQKKARWSKEQKKNRKGQNKARPCPFRVDRASCLCSSLIDSPTDSEAVAKFAAGRPDDQKRLFECRGEATCTYLHDVQSYLETKQPDIAEECPVFRTRGHCPWGLSCRFGGAHLTTEGKNMVDAEKMSKYASDPRQGTTNALHRELQENLRKRRYDFSRAEAAVAACSRNKKPQEVRENGKSEEPKAPIPDVTAEDKPANSEEPVKTVGALTDEDVIKSRQVEKKKIDWHDKLYLSPLTTVGNLPFRRVCKEMGADVTCGEMAMASSLLQGAVQEWALTKRHRSEDIFGVQICGNNPHVMSRCAQMLEEQISLDFLDINLGCPIELVYEQGGGSGLLRRERVLEEVVRSTTGVLRQTPLTAKLRTGVYSGKNVAHELVPKFADWGVSHITLHGRSREQRYSKLADWPYIEQCAELAAQRGVPLFGNGDVLSWEDYRRVRGDYPHVAGVAIGRGALYKPWIFTEIKESRHWDISSSERLDVLRKFVNYGLEHWGSDYKGVENTRRFLLEWLSFLYRYVPVGLLERPPQKMNERPPPYVGRDDLETLMASANCADWLKISEMLLGPVPADYKFLPKHKASAWA